MCMCECACVFGGSSVWHVRNYLGNQINYPKALGPTVASRAWKEDIQLGDEAHPKQVLKGEKFVNLRNGRSGFYWHILSQSASSS